MAEGKKRAYKRETCQQKICEFVERAKRINAGEADYQYYNHVQDIILFGSMLNTEKDMVHDINLFVRWSYDGGLMKKFYNDNKEVARAKFDNIVTRCFAEWLLAQRYLRGRCGIFSVWSNVVDGKDAFDAATEEGHLYLMKDGVVNEKAMELFRKK